MRVEKTEGRRGSFLCDSCNGSSQPSSCRPVCLPPHMLRMPTKATLAAGQGCVTQSRSMGPHRGVLLGDVYERCFSTIPGDVENDSFPEFGCSCVRINCLELQ